MDPEGPVYTPVTTTPRPRPTPPSLTPRGPAAPAKAASKGAQLMRQPAVAGSVAMLVGCLVLALGGWLGWMWAWIAVGGTGLTGGVGYYGLKARRKNGRGPLRTGGSGGGRWPGLRRLRGRFGGGAKPPGGGPGKGLFGGRFRPGGPARAGAGRPGLRLGAGRPGGSAKPGPGGLKGLLGRKFGSSQARRAGNPGIRPGGGAASGRRVAGFRLPTFGRKAGGSGRPSAAGGGGQSGGRSWKSPWKRKGGSAAANGSGRRMPAPTGTRRPAKSASTGRSRWKPWRRAKAAAAAPAPAPTSAAPRPTTTTRPTPPPPAAAARPAAPTAPPAPGRSAAPNPQPRSTGGTVSQPGGSVRPATATEDLGVVAFLKNTKGMGDQLREQARKARALAAQAAAEQPLHPAVVASIETYADRYQTAADAADMLWPAGQQSNASDFERVDGPRGGSHEVESKADSGRTHRDGAA